MWRPGVRQGVDAALCGPGASGVWCFCFTSFFIITFRDLFIWKGRVAETEISPSAGSLPRVSMLSIAWPSARPCLGRGYTEASPSVTQLPA